MSSSAHYLYSGAIHVATEPCNISTVLGTCISVCLWDEQLRYGGMNHFLLPLWDGSGLASPRYGNVAVMRLIEDLEAAGAKRSRLKAKVFGGKEVGNDRNALINIGWRNATIAMEELKEANIQVTAMEVGGDYGRKIIFDTATGGVKLKRFRARPK